MLKWAGNGTPYIPSVGFLLFVGLPLLLLQDSHSLHPVAELPCQELLVPDLLLSFPPSFPPFFFLVDCVFRFKRLEATL